MKTKIDKLRKSERGSDGKNGRKKCRNKKISKREKKSLQIYEINPSGTTVKSSQHVVAEIPDHTRDMKI